MEADLDKEFMSAVVDAVSPTMTPGGLVAVNFFNMRDFALMTSPVTNRIQVVDLSTGTTMTISHSAYTPSALSIPQAESTAVRTTPVPGTGTKPVLIRVIATLRSIVTNPLTFLTFALVLIFGVFYRIARKSAEA